MSTQTQNVAGPVDRELRERLEQFLFLEAELLEQRQFRDWLALIADDIRYTVRVRSDSGLRAGQESLYDEGLVFDDDRQSLEWRVRRIETGMAWAEQPPSRTRYLLTNLRAKASTRIDEYAVTMNVIVYRNRLDATEDLLVGRRDDLLRIDDAGISLAGRAVTLDCSVLPVHNLSFFL